jgi:uncharacterized protein YjbI with pentapeptide repeats
MTPDVTTLPISPQTFWIIAGLAGVSALSALVYWALRSMDGKHRPPLWEDLPKRGQGIAVFLGLAWVGLFALTIIAAYVGVWMAIHPQGEASQPNLGLGALLAALLGAPFVIWGTWLKYQTVRFQKEGHMTDRINKAVEQLGAEKTVKVPGKDAEGKDITLEETRPNIEVRIGAILSLERIAQDSTLHDKGRDHVRVMEILCAYVRENSNARKPSDFPEPEWKPWKFDSPDRETFDLELYTRMESRRARFGQNHSDSKAWKWAQNLSEPRADVAQVLQVIGRRTWRQRRVEASWPDTSDETTVWPFDLPCPSLPEVADDTPLTSVNLDRYREAVRIWKERIRLYNGYRLDLQGANLQGAKLSRQRHDSSGAVFSGAIMTNARLEGADLRGAFLVGAKLWKAQLLGVDLSRANAEGADLHDAILEGGNLDRARLSLSFMAATRLDGATLSNARLDSAILANVRMDGAYLFDARVQLADLTGGRMEGASLGGTRLEMASLREAHVQGATLNYTFMQGADLTDARFYGATIAMSDLCGARLSGVGLNNCLLLGTEVSSLADANDLQLSGAAVHDVDLTGANIDADQFSLMFADADLSPVSSSSFG